MPASRALSVFFCNWLIELEASAVSGMPAWLWWSSLPAFVGLGLLLMSCMLAGCCRVGLATYCLRLLNLFEPSIHTKSSSKLGHDSTACIRGQSKVHAGIHKLKSGPSAQLGAALSQPRPSWGPLAPHRPKPAPRWSERPPEGSQKPR